ncbi:MAG: DUF2905 domain-containing protein [Actinobacteria bacterium]|nr:DUF2905 domain-containing protein [Actinomycetota bacterium]
MSFNNFSTIGKILIFIGAGIAVLGLILFLGSKIPFFGRLPGDISIRRENFSLYFPVSTSIIISIVLTVIINVIIFLIFKFRK